MVRYRVRLAKTRIHICVGVGCSESFVVGTLAMRTSVAVGCEGTALAGCIASARAFHAEDTVARSGALITARRHPVQGIGHVVESHPPSASSVVTLPFLPLENWMCVLGVSSKCGRQTEKERDFVRGESSVTMPKGRCPAGGRGEEHHRGSGRLFLTREYVAA